MSLTGPTSVVRISIPKYQHSPFLNRQVLQQVTSPIVAPKVRGQLRFLCGALLWQLATKRFSSAQKQFLLILASRLVTGQLILCLELCGLVFQPFQDRPTQRVRVLISSRAARSMSLTEASAPMEYTVKPREAISACACSMPDRYAQTAAGSA